MTKKKIRLISAFIFVSVLCMFFSVTVFLQEDPIILEPQNEIPLLIIRIDESEKAIADAKEKDSEHVYGKVSDMNDSPDHSVRCVGTVEIIVPDEYEGEYGSVSVPAGEIKLDYIRGRGNSTWDLAIKKPYKFKLSEANDLFGMGSSKEWAILANDKDSTLIKNRIIMWLGDQLGLKYTPKMVPVDVVMIGSESDSRYLGSYCLSELVNIEESRLDIPKLKKNDTVENADISGGYLISIHNMFQDYDEPDSNWFATEKSGITFNHENPSFESEPVETGRIQQREYIRNYINEIDDLIMTDEENIDEERHNRIGELLDLTSTADYWWVQEFSKNGDAFDTNSTYLYKERDGKLFLGPLWDFDLSFVEFSDTMVVDTLNFNNTEMVWIDQLREKDPYFIELLKQRFEVLNKKLEELTKDGGIIDQYRDEVKLSRVADEKVRNPEYWDEKTVSEEYASRIERFKNVIDTRRKWMADNLDLLDKVHFTITFEADGQIIDTVTARGEGGVYDVERLPDKDDSLFMGWVEKESGVTLNDYIVKSDAVFVPSYKSIDELIEPKQLFLSKYEDYTKLSNLDYMIYDVEVVPEEAAYDAFCTARWSSSDESIATVDDMGMISLLKEGDVEISITLYNGLSRTMLLHVYDDKKIKLVPPHTMKHDPETVTLKQGDVFQISTYFECGDEPCAILVPNFESSDPEIADINYMGIITALKPGKVTIVSEAFFTDPEVKKEPLHSSFEVIVTDASKQVDPESGLPAYGKTVLIFIGAALIYLIVRVSKKNDKE